jgi:hypothetical protein
MNDDLLKLQQIIAKTFRKAKRWYVGYLLCQLLVLAFAVVSIFAQMNPNLSALIAFLGVLATECIRWRSDAWKSEAESAKRKWEVADGLGVVVDGSYIADWLAAKPKGFLRDVTTIEIQGSEFDSTRPVGALRAVENTLESAWWSRHLSRRMAVYLSFILMVVIVAALIALMFSIAALKSATVQQSGAVVQNVGGILCSVLVFVFSINVVRLLAEFLAFATEAKEVLGRCAELLKTSAVTERDALAVIHEYQTARNSAPLLPTFVWIFHGKHLREQWAHFRPQRSGQWQG